MAHEQACIEFGDELVRGESGLPRSRGQTEAARNFDLAKAQANIRQAFELGDADSKRLVLREMREVALELIECRQWKAPIQSAEDRRVRF